MKINLEKKFCGYANLYKHIYMTPWKENRIEYFIGEPAEKIEDLPDYHEYDNEKYKYIGIISLNSELLYKYSRDLNIKNREI